MNLPTPSSLLADEWKIIIAIAFTTCVLNLLWTAYGNGLRSVPGPFTARFTRLYMVFQASRFKQHSFYNDLHRKYGRIVRIGPNKVSISDPDVIPVIYSITSNYGKSTFYDAFRASFKGHLHENIFATRDTAWHRNHKSIVAPAYALSSLRQLEPLIDECTATFLHAMDDLAGQVVDLGEWLHWWAFDVIANITFAQTFGLLDERQDRRDVIAGIETGSRYNTVVGQIPELHPWLIGNATLMDLLMKIPAIAKTNPIITLAKMTNEAMAASQHLDFDKTRGDFLEYLRRAQKKDPERLPDRDVSSALFTNLFAGSDTTATALRAIFYFLVKNPEKLAKLRSEIDGAEKEGKLAEFVDFKQGSALVYLHAVLKESLRLQPSVSYPLERTVPAGGAELCGKSIPAGSVVGVHAWVVHRDKTIFGDDAERFRPERWIDIDAEQLRTMERAFLAFGAGSRTCMGKNVSMLEMTKLVPQLLRRYDIEWASSKPEWDVAGYWFAKQDGVLMRLRRREEEA